jgi:hypothetical protein
MATVWTYGFLLIFAFYAMLVIVPLVNGSTPNVMDVAVAVLLAALIIYAWVRSVKRYRIEGDHLVIERAGPGRVHITLDKIETAEFQPDLGSFYNTRPFALGGLFGWAGEARVRKPTDIQSLEAAVYGTNPRKAVLLKLKDGRSVIVTPEDPEALVAALRSRTPKWLASRSGGRQAAGAQRNRKPRRKK